MCAYSLDHITLEYLQRHITFMRNTYSCLHEIYNVLPRFHKNLCQLFNF